MKGVIAVATKELIQKKFGEEVWKKVLEKAGFKEELVILPSSDVDDEVVLKIVKAICEVLNLSLPQVADAFGDYWMTEYAPLVYKPFFRNVHSAKDFLLKMDAIHVATTSTLPDATPPRFEYEWRDDKTLIMTYKSKRSLIDFAIGLAKGVGKYFGENLRVNKIDDKHLEIKFL